MTAYWGLGRRKYERVVLRAYRDGRAAYGRGEPYPGLPAFRPPGAGRRETRRFLRERSFELGWFEALHEDPRLSHKERTARMEPIVFPELHR